ncbi:MAG: T9SS type A sorting domain-containing protein [Paludibacter sp.]
MKTKFLLFVGVFSACTLVVSADNYKVFQESFGKPTTLISKTLDNSPADTVTATSISNGTYVVLNARGSGNGSITLDATAISWPTDANAYAGVITSTSVFNASTPITSFDGNNSGFAAYTSKNNQNNTGNPWTWMRIFIDGERLVVGAQYSFSFRYANGANSNWIPDAGITATTGGTNIQVRGYIYPNVNNLNSSPTWQNIASNGSSNSNTGADSGYTTSSTWSLYSITTDPAKVVGQGSNMVCDIRGWLNVGSILLIDSVNVTGPQPVLMAQQNSVNINSLTINGSSSSAELSDALTVGCNAGGTHGIKATITGADASCFSLVDASGTPIPNNNIALPGGDLFIKFAPDASASGSKTAILTLSASSNPNYGAAPITINLAGNIGANGLNTVQNQRTLIIKNNPVGNYLTVSTPFTGNVEWSIYNSAGSRVFSTVGSTQLSTDVSTLTTGIYMVTALNKTTGENGVVKFLKK